MKNDRKCEQKSLSKRGREETYSVYENVHMNNGSSGSDYSPKTVNREETDTPYENVHIKNGTNGGCSSKTVHDNFNSNPGMNNGNSNRQYRYVNTLI
jgi:hypothetical protein